MYRFDFIGYTLQKENDRIAIDCSAYDFGKFNLDGYGKARQYVFKDNPPYILVTLENDILLISGKTKEETKVYYRLMTE